MIENFMNINEFGVEYLNGLITLIFLSNIVFMVMDLINNLRR